MGWRRARSRRRRSRRPADPELVWGLIDHLTVAQLNEVFEIDPEVAKASLDPDYLDAAFPGLLREIVTG